MLSIPRFIPSRSKATLISGSIFLVLILVVAGLAVVSFLRDDPDGSAPSIDAFTGLAGVAVVGDFGTVPRVAVKDADYDELTSAVVTKGDGPTSDDEHWTVLHYGIWSGNDGQPFTTCMTWGTGVPVVLGGQAACTINGISDLVEGQPGTRIVFAEPIEDALGTDDVSSSGLSEGDNVVGVIDIEAVVAKGPSGAAATLPPGVPVPVVDDESGAVTGFDWAGVKSGPGGTEPQTTQLHTVVAGKGEPVTADQALVINYTESILGSEKAYSSSWAAPTPLATLIDDQSVIAGWAKTLPGVTVGSRVVLVVPPDEAFGDTKHEGIPAGSTLVFAIDVLAAVDRPEVASTP